MATFSDDKLADLREQQHDPMMGYAGVQDGGMTPLIRATGRWRRASSNCGGIRSRWP